jgi:hypothetical protein
MELTQYWCPHRVIYRSLANGWLHTAPLKMELPPTLRAGAKAALLCSGLPGRSYPSSPKQHARPRHVAVHPVDYLLRTYDNHLRCQLPPV